MAKNRYHNILKKHSSTACLTAIILCILPIIGCKHGVSDKPTETDSISYNQLAETMMYDGAPTDEYMAVQQKALEQMYSGKSPDAAVNVLSQTGYFYRRNGDYRRALEYLHEAMDTLNSNPTSGTVRGNIKLMGNLSNLYSTLGLSQEALELNAKAIDYAKTNDPVMLSELWRMRGAQYAYINQWDKALCTYDSALIAVRQYNNTPMYLRTLKSDRAISYIEWKSNPDTIRSMIAELEKLSGDSTSDQNVTATERFITGLGYVKIGQTSKGIPIMEQAMNEFEELQWDESIAWGLRLLANAYAKAGDGKKLAKIFPRYVSEVDSSAVRNKINSAIGADFRWRTSIKEAENQLMEQKLKFTQRNNTLLWTATIFAIIAMIALIILFIERHKTAKRKIAESWNEINKLLSTQQALNSKIEELNETLEKAQSHEQTVERAVAPPLNPVILTKEDEVIFRRSFNSLYPNLIKNLKSEFPTLTTKDELLCMLIYLKLNSEETALSLGITRASVNTARYRLRQRLSLNNNDDLDRFIQSRS